MDKNERYMISIVGEQTMDGETDRIEVLTAGKFMKKNDKYYINYKEYDEENPNDYSDNLIKVDRNVVTINRRGALGSQLMLEKGRRHQCIYSTIAGDMSIGVFTRTFENRLSEKGGTLEVSYTLDFNTDLVSENRFIISIEEKQNM
ncbi:MAG TPA: DUF1934 domain-containing protein [Ruminococcaceae bacterium]|nr:DUF1934 domain-containing protein [Oscillospiraceae bacterium]